MISVRLIIHNTYVILCNEIFDMFTPGIIVWPQQRILWLFKSPYMIYGEGSCCSKLSKCWELRKRVEEYIQNIWLFLCLDWQKQQLLGVLFVNQFLRETWFYKYLGTTRGPKIISMNIDIYIKTSYRDVIIWFKKWFLKTKYRWIIFRHQ